MLTGLVPCGVSCGLLTAGTVLLMQHTAKAGDDTAGLAVRPVQLLLPLLCAALCLLIGLAVKDGLSTELAETVAQRIHERRYDQTTNSMPEGELKTCPHGIEMIPRRWRSQWRSPERSTCVGRSMRSIPAAAGKQADNERNSGI